MLKSLVFGLSLCLIASTALAGAPQIVRVTTSMGAFEIALDRDKAPKTVANFLRYTKEGHYNNTIFHRVIPNFMIQGGGLDYSMQKKGGHQPIPNEADNGLHNVIGSVAMARTSDPNSATDQFFINTHNNSFLDFRNRSSRGWGYAVFGKVISGMDVVRRIEAVATHTLAGRQNVPRTPIIIKMVKLVAVDLAVPRAKK
ncbi:MAG: peptidylprolyl isomerase [Mariprofundales bacterium]